MKPMEESKNELYHPLILEHNQHPWRFEKKPEAALVLVAYNPLCGDKFKIFLDFEGEKVTRAGFHGYGCAVSKASASVLCKKLEGLNKAEIEELLRQFRAQFAEAAKAHEDEELQAFAVAKEFPGRLTCATLAWDAVGEWVIINH
jgi:nitrogen fixation protein NifU and related proteins